MKNSTNRKFMAVLMTLCLCLSFTACGNKGDSSEDVDSGDYIEEIGNGISFDEEAEDAEIVKADADDSKFYGSWQTTSDYASYLYGNINITIKEDGTWSGNITDTDMTGTWKRDGQDLVITNEYIDLSLCFTENGTLVMQRNLSAEDEDPEMVNTVLVKE